MKPDVGRSSIGSNMKPAPKWQYDEKKTFSVVFIDIGEVQSIELGVKAI